jgi:hypothetical protein
MPQTINYSMPAKHPIMAAPHELIWIQEPDFLGWGCSKCAWVFKPLGPPLGDSLEEMKENYLCLRDDEYSAHLCTEQLKAKQVGIQIVRTTRHFLRRIPQRGMLARPGVARQRTARHNGTRF